MQNCYNHYYCLCGRYENERICHYCRKQENFYRRHYICLTCCIGWKSKHEIILKPSIDGGQLQEYDTNCYAGARCRNCSEDALEVGRDFRVPKQTDKKSWKELKHSKDDMKEKYTYNCGQRKGESLYEKRSLKNKIF